MKNLYVKARKGVLVPYEGEYRRFITEETTVSVPSSAYYLRRIVDEDLIVVEVVQNGDESEKIKTAQKNANSASTPASKGEK